MSDHENKNGAHPGVSVSLEDITPEIAAEWLKRLAPGQRRLNNGHVSRIAEDMLAGRYACNGSPIRFDENAYLIDGQHRLTAAVKAQFTLHNVVVVRGLLPEAITSIDTGCQGRTVADVLTMRGAGKHVPLSLTAAVTLEHFDFEYYPFRRSSQSLKVHLWEALDDSRKEQVATLYRSLKSGRINNAFLLAAGLRCAAHDDQTYQFLQEAFANTPGAPAQGALLYNTAVRMLAKKQISNIGPHSYQLSWCVFRAVQVFWASDALQHLRPPAHWPTEERTWDGFMKRAARPAAAAAKEPVQ